jgi:dTDP-4-dehydrorhamnose reductase
MNNIKVLILGANGLIGNNISKFLYVKNIKIICGVRNKKKKFLKKADFIYYGDLEKIKNIQKLKNYIIKINPNYIINCCGITKHSNINKKKINFTLLKKIMNIAVNFFFIHISTDCVFLGQKGNYAEESRRDAADDYGKTKIMAEQFLESKKNCIILRTSTIGHEINTAKGLLEWFLKNKNQNVYGYFNSIFSGPTTLELAKIIYNFILKKKILTHGLFNISSNSIDKYSLLKIIKKIYNKKIDIKKNLDIKVNRSLDASKFIKITKYKTKSWKVLIKQNKQFNEKEFFL